MIAGAVRHSEAPQPGDSIVSRTQPVNRILAIALACGVSAPPALSAQEVRARATLQQRDRVAALELPATLAAAEFTVSPGTAVRAALRAAPARGGANFEAAPPPSPPDPIPPATLDLVASAVGGEGGGGGMGSRDVQNPGPPELDHIELDARRPWAANRGYLEFVLPYDIVLESTPAVNFNKNYPGLFSIHLKVEEGRSYLVDISIGSWGGGTYEVNAGDSTQEFADPQGNLEHLLVALEATASGWIDLTVKRRDGSGYYLYGVEVDRVK